VKFCAIGVTRATSSPLTSPAASAPAHQGLSAIQYPRILDSELTTTLHYVLGNGTLHWVRFQDFHGFPENRNAARRIRQAIHDLVYDPNAALGAIQSAAGLGGQTHQAIERPRRPASSSPLATVCYLGR
jgi:hypothetical protein